MLMRQVVRRVGRALRSGMAALESRFKDWTRPAKTNQVTATLADLTRCKGELMAENVFLRQQLIVLERQVARPQLRQRDRQVLVVLASRLRTWREALIVVKPDTLIGWHRLGFKLYWRRKSRVRQGRPPLAPEIIVLIEEMVLNNRTWRAERIRGELLKLGIQVSRETVKKNMRRARKEVPPRQGGQSWATFLANHAGETWACDFVQTYDLLFRTIFVYFIVELGSRRVVHYGVTRAPSDVWVAQQVREATPYEERPRFLIRDNDKKYGQRFTGVAQNRQIDVLRTPVRAPRANAIMERFIGSVRRECLGHMLILSERQLYCVVRDYVAYFIHARPHQRLGQRIPDPPEVALDSAVEGRHPIIGYPVLGGLHHDYRRVA